MPKRITRSNKEKNSIFMSGFNAGTNAIIMGLQITQLRNNTGKTTAEVAEATGFTEDHLKGLEAGNYKDFMMLDIETVTKLAKYFDVAASISFKAQDNVKEPVADKINVPTFEEEFHA